MNATTTTTRPALAAANELRITNWRSLTATQGEEVALPWSGLAAKLASPAPRPVDAARPALGGWSAATFEGTRRSKDRVELVTALVFDLDSGTVTADDLRAAFAGRSALFHNTRSSTADAQCWRVVEQLSRPVTAAEHATLWAAARDRLAALGIVLDEQTKDPSRLWFVPCVPVATDYVLEAVDGEPLDVDAELAVATSGSLQLRAVARADVSPAATSASLPASASRASDEPAWLRAISRSTRKRRASAWLDLAEVAVQGERGSNAAMRVATAVVRGFALDRTSALEVLAAWNARCVPPWSPAELAHKIDEAERVGAMTWGAKLAPLSTVPRSPSSSTPSIARGRAAAERADLGDEDEDEDEDSLDDLEEEDGGAEDDGDDGPAIRIDVDLARVVDEAVEALSFDRDVYQRDAQLVHVVRVPETEADAFSLAGAPQIRALASATLRERLAAAVRWEKFDNRKHAWKPCVPTSDVVSAVASRGMWRGVRPIVGVIETPSLRPDGSVIQSPGHDAATGFVLVPGDSFPEVPSQPTREDAARALAELAEPLAEFPYRSEADRAVTLAAILTVVARPAVRGAVPAFLFDASTPGSGKTLQADIVSLIATGRVAGGMGFPVDEEELEKVLGSYALRGSALVNFDNITRPFGGGPLDKCLTATDTVDLRVLGKSEVASLRWRATMMGTGNNIELVGDTVRRVLFSRLEPAEERPEDRSGFRIGDLRAWVRTNRARLVVAALTVLRAYAAHGRPDVGVRPWGSFEAWSALIPAALVWAGGADPMLTRPAADAAVEPQKAALMTVLDAWPRLAGSEGLSAKRVVQLLYPGGQEPSNGPPDGFDDLREALEALTGANGRAPSPARVGVALRRAKGRNVGGRQLDGVTDRNGVMRWSVTASRTSAPPSAAETAGDAGDEGHVSTHARENAERKYTIHGGAGENGPSSPASPAPSGGGRGAEGGLGPRGESEPGSGLETDAAAFGGVFGDLIGDGRAS